MRSYADYQKKELLSNLNVVDVRTGFNNHFDILKYDLLEAIQLPTMMLENITQNVQYDRLRKDDLNYTSHYIEDVIGLCKANFFDTLIEDVHSTHTDSLDTLKSELVAKVSDMIKGLKEKITQMLASTEAEPEEETPASGGTPTPAGSGSSPAGSNSTSAPTGSSSATSPSASAPTPTPSSSAPASGSSNKKAPWDQPTTPFAGTRDPAKANADGFQPAPYGSMKPSDGFWGGLKRLGKAYVQRPLNWLTRGVRNAWHGHDANNVRTMSKESVDSVEMLLIENAQAVLDVVDQFHQELLAYIDQQIIRIAKLVGHNPAVATTVKPAVLPDPKTPATGATGTAPAGAPRIPVTARDGQPNPALGGSDTAAQGIPDPVANDTAAQKGAAVATGSVPEPTETEPEPQEQQVSDIRDSKAALEGAKLLGLQVNHIGKSGGWNHVTPQDIVLAGGKTGSGWADVRNHVYDALWTKIQESEDGQTMIAAYRAHKKSQPHPEKEGKTQHGTINKSDRRKLTAQWLNTEIKGSRSALITMLASYYRKTKGIPSIAKPAATAETPAAENPAGATPAAPTPSANPAQEPAIAARGLTPPPTGAPRIPVTARDAAPVSTEKMTPQSLAKTIESSEPELWEDLVNDFKGNLTKVYDLLNKGLAKGLSVEAITSKLKEIAAAAKGSTAPATEAPPTEVAPETAPMGSKLKSPIPDQGVNKVAAFKKLVDTERHDPANADYADLLDPSALDDDEIASLIGDIDVNDPSAGNDLLKKYMDAVGTKLGGEAPPDEDSSMADALDKLKSSETEPVTTEPTGTMHSGGYTSDEPDEPEAPPVRPVMGKRPITTVDPVAKLKAAREMKDKAAAAAKAKVAPIPDSEVDPTEQLTGEEGVKHLDNSRIFKVLIKKYEDLLNSFNDDPSSTNKEITNVVDGIFEKVQNKELTVADALNALRDAYKERKAAADDVNTAIFNKRRSGDEGGDDADDGGSDLADQNAGVDRMRRESFSDIVNRFKKLIHG